MAGEGEGKREAVRVVEVENVPVSNDVSRPVTASKNQRSGRKMDNTRELRVLSI
jgi:hypothetical protein